MGEAQLSEGWFKTCAQTLLSLRPCRLGQTGHAIRLLRSYPLSGHGERASIGRRSFRRMIRGTRGRGSRKRTADARNIARREQRELEFVDWSQSFGHCASRHEFEKGLTQQIGAA